MRFTIFLPYDTLTFLKLKKSLLLVKKGGYNAICCYINE